MSVFITHSRGVAVIRARSGGHDDPFVQLTTVLSSVLRSADRVVLDLSGVTLAPSRTVSAFVEHLSALSRDVGAHIVVVADRLSARRVLRAVVSEPGLLIAPSVPAALESHPAAPVPRSGWSR